MLVPVPGQAPEHGTAAVRVLTGSSSPRPCAGAGGLGSWGLSSRRAGSSTLL